MSEPLLTVLERLGGELLAPDTLLRAVASGKRRNDQPPWRRVEVRYVDLKAGRHLQVVKYDATQAHTSNHLAGAEAAAAVAELLAMPFGNWHVESTTHTHQMRVTKKLEAVISTKARTGDAEPVSRDHDRAKHRLLPEDHRVLAALGISDAQGRIKPSRQAKYRQVEEFLHQLDAALTEALATGRLRTPTAEEPLRVVDLGCGNAYLTFAAHAWLAEVRGLPAVVTGIDVKQQSADHNSQVAAQLGLSADFVVGAIADAVWTDPAGPPEVVLALHACDTATDDALARAIGWDAPLVLAAPCCHHDLSAQLRKVPAPTPYAMLTSDGILRERFADTLTDAVRSTLLQMAGYKVDVVEFVDSAHTPRNTLLRAIRTPSRGGEESLRAQYTDLVAAWQIRPRLSELLAGERRS